MQIFKAEFNDYEVYQEFTRNWDVDFRMLSKSSFYVYLNMFLSDTIQVSRTALNGKVDQYGLSPEGFRSIVIPACKEDSFVWLGKKVPNNQILIFPKDRTLDALSFDGFEIFIIDIKEDFLLQTLENLKFGNALKIFKGQEQFLDIEIQFINKLHHLIETFLQQAMIQQSRNSIQENLYDYLLNSIITPILKKIDDSMVSSKDSTVRKRDIALNTAVDIINSQIEKTPSISSLCKQTNVSERTLEYAFLEKYRVSPSEFIKATRLHKVRNELISSNHNDSLVSTLANKYGFWHLSQFTADFKKQFGVLPSKVLRRE